MNLCTILKETYGLSKEAPEITSEKLRERLTQSHLRAFKAIREPYLIIKDKRPT